MAGDFESTPVATVTPFGRAARRFKRNKLGVVALGYLVFMIVLAVCGRWIMPHDPNRQQFQPFLGPSGENWLGTDDLGRDLASRLIDGASVSVRAGYQTVAMALVIAIPLGLVAGYMSGRVDSVLMRIMDALMSFPALILALVIAAILGPGLGNAMIAITIVLIPGFVRLTRASTLAVAQETYVEASRSIGTPTRHILRRRVLPSVVSPIIVAASLVLGIALIAEASLSFLGLGTQAPDASWGNMLRRGYTYLNGHPMQIVPPAVAIALAVFSFNIVGDALRDALGLSETAPPRGTKRGRMGLTIARGRTDVDARNVPESSAGQVGVAGEVKPAEGTPATLLSVRGLTVEFATHDGPVTVVDDVSFDVRRGEVVGLVGESGSGKTVTSMSIMRLLSSPPARISAGQVLFDGIDLLDLSFEQMATLRGSALSMVFQDPLSSLNPAFTIGNQLTEAVRLHRQCSKRTARIRSLELLDLVGIPAPNSRMKDYPHQLSGGMRQRVLIAMALANDPQLVIADEPTTAVDVTVQAQIITLLKSLQRDLDMAMIFVSHDLGVIADLADRAIVMYAGEIVESASTEELFANPQHPYTRKLLSATPQAAPLGGRLPSIPGVVPAPGHWPVGCRFSTRCDFASDDCLERPVELTRPGVQHEVRCVRAGQLEREIAT